MFLFIAVFFAASLGFAAGVICRSAWGHEEA